MSIDIKMAAQELRVSTKMLMDFDFETTDFELPEVFTPIHEDYYFAFTLRGTIEKCKNGNEIREKEEYVSPFSKEFEECSIHDSYILSLFSQDVVYPAILTGIENAVLSIENEFRLQSEDSIDLDSCYYITLYLGSCKFVRNFSKTKGTEKNLFDVVSRPNPHLASVFYLFGVYFNPELLEFYDLGNGKPLSSFISNAIH